MEHKNLYGICKKFDMECNYGKIIEDKENNTIYFVNMDVLPNEIIKDFINYGGKGTTIKKVKMEEIETEEGVDYSFNIVREWSLNKGKLSSKKRNSSQDLEWIVNQMKNQESGARAAKKIFRGI